MLRSRHNELLRTARALSRRKGREQSGLFRVDGRRAVTTVLDHGAAVVALLITPDQADGPLPERVRAAGGRVEQVAPELLAEATELVQPDGVVALVRQPVVAFDQVAACDRIVVLDGVQDPGNVGTVLRTADAVGAGVLLAAGCADPLSPKVVRASAGAVVRVPWLRRDPPYELPHEVVVLDSRGGRPLTQVALPHPLLLVAGSEAHGPRPAWQAYPRLHLPMREGAESLNVAIAVAVALYRTVA